MADKPNRYTILEENGEKVIIDRHRAVKLDLDKACRELNVHMEYENWLSDEWDKEKEAKRAENEAWHQRYARATGASRTVPTTRTIVDLRQRRRRAAA